MTEAEIAALNLKEGDEVEVTYPMGGKEKGVIIPHYNHEGKIFACMFEGKGTKGFWVVDPACPKEIKIIKRMNYTLETVPVGGFVKDAHEDRRRVLGVFGDGDTRLLFLSTFSEHEEFGSILTVKQAKDYGYTAVNESDSDVVEVDMDEIAKWKNVPVDKIRVKKAE